MRWIPASNLIGKRITFVFREESGVGLIMTVEKVMYKADFTLLFIRNVVVFLSRLCNKRTLKVFYEEK